MTENIEAAELRAQLDECQRIIAAQASEIAELRRVHAACGSHNEMLLAMRKAAEEKLVDAHKTIEILKARSEV